MNIQEKIHVIICEYGRTMVRRTHRITDHPTRRYFRGGETYTSINLSKTDSRSKVKVVSLLIQNDGYMAIRVSIRDEDPDSQVFDLLDEIKLLFRSGRSTGGYVDFPINNKSLEQAISLAINQVIPLCERYDL